MVEISDIKDKDSLRAWLENQPREVSVWIASRAAARALPVWWDAVLTANSERKTNATGLLVLRLLLVSTLAAYRPKEEIRNACFAHIKGVQGLKSAFSYRFLTKTSSARATIDMAMYACAVASNRSLKNPFSTRLTHSGAARYASHVAALSASTKQIAAATAWQAIRTDAVQGDGVRLPDDLPLWSGEAGPLAGQWANIKANLGKSSDLPDWQFWMEWYDSLLSGRTMLPDRPRTLEMLEKIALINPVKWNKGADSVNPLIRKIWEGYRGIEALEVEILQAADDGIVLNYNPETDRLYQEDMPADRPDRLKTALAKLNEVRLLVREMGNLQGVLGSELFLIERAVDHHPDNATMLYFNAKAARGLLQANIGNESCPSPASEPVIGLLDTMLLDTQNTLLPEPSVQEGLKDRAEDSALLESPEALQALEEAAEEIAEVSEGSLAEELPDNAEKAKDLYQPRAVRMSALVSAVSAVVQAWVIAGYARFKAALCELDDITARTARISKNIVLIGGTGGVGYGALQVVTNSPKVEAAVKAIIALF